jgi:CRP-like cAMP-binding protein
MKTLTLEQCEAEDLHLYSDGICANIREEHLAKLRETGEWLVAQDEVIVADGMEQRSLYIVVEGEVEIYKYLTTEGKTEKQTFSTLSTGHCFGEMAFLSGGIASANVGAKGRVVLWRMSHEMLLRYIDECKGGSQLVLNIAAELSARVQDGNTRLLEVSKRIGEQINHAKVTGKGNLDGIEKELHTLMKAYKGMEANWRDEDYRPLLLAAALGIGGILFGAWQFFGGKADNQSIPEQAPAHAGEAGGH